MHLRGLPVRRAFKTKIVLLSLVVITLIFYIKFSSTSVDGIENESSIIYGNRKVIAGKLVNEYNGENDVVPANIDEPHQQPATERSAHKPHFNAKYEQMINADLAKQQRDLGSNGRSAALTDPVAKQIGEHQLSKIALNEELSEHISYNRTLDDARNPMCRDDTYDLDNLPTTSVVIIFYNEPYSVLVRTVHSVLNTVDKRLLKEIILVDDRSTNAELKEKLDYYIGTRLPPNMVKTIRLKHR